MKTKLNRTPTAIAPGMDHAPFEALRFETPIRIRELCALLGVAKTHVYSEIRKGRLAAPLKMGAKISFWKIQNAMDYIALCTKESHHVA